MCAVQMTDTIEEDILDVCDRVGEALQGLSGSTILAAGGGGFIGSFFLDVIAYASDHILEQPATLVCVDNYQTGMPDRVAHLRDSDNFVFRRHDITEPLDLGHDVDYIIHMASIASPPRYRENRLPTVDVNVLGTRNLLELARQHSVKSFLYLSSSEVYGDPSPDALPTPETYPGNVSFTGPRACYDESKRLAECLCAIYYEQFGLPVKVVRPFNVYGPRLNLDDGRVMPDFIRNALDGNPIELYSDGRATRSFCYISDAVAASLLLLLSSNNGEPFNVGNDEEITIERLAQEVSLAFDDHPNVQFASSKDPDYLVDNPQRRCPDLTKVKQAIPWEPTVMLREGIRRTIQWHKEHPGDAAWM